MDETLFTPESARKTLSSLRPTVDRMRALYRRLESRRPERITPDQPVAPTYYALLVRLLAARAKIQERGVRVTDVRSGLLDFPAKRDGRTVLLCWRAGESALEYWHEAGAGYDGRRRVDEDGPWEDS